jgi:hypothetical protein
MTPNQELSRLHFVLLDEEFFLTNASSLEDSFCHREVAGNVTTLPGSSVFCESFGASMILTLTESQRCQGTPHSWNIRGFPVSRRSPYSSAFLLLGYGPLLLGVDLQ